MVTGGTPGALDPGMAYVISKKCVGVCDTGCVKVCPCDCIVGEIEGQMVIDPDPCIDCGACIDECPVDAIAPEDVATPADTARNAELAARFLSARVR